MTDGITAVGQLAKPGAGVFDRGDQGVNHIYGLRAGEAVHKDQAPSKIPPLRPTKTARKMPVGIMLAWLRLGGLLKRIYLTIFISLLFSFPVSSQTKSELYQFCVNQANFQCNIFNAGAGSVVILSDGGYLYGACALYKTSDPTGRGAYGDPCGHPGGLSEGCPNSEVFNFDNGVCGPSPKNPPGGPCPSVGGNAAPSSVGNPINTNTANKHMDETDFQLTGPVTSALFSPL